MDRINRLANELLIGSDRLKKAGGRLERILRRGKGIDGGAGGGPHRWAGHELEKGLSEMERQVTSSAILSRELIDIIRATRLSAVETMACLFEKAVRDLALKSGRRVVFSIEGRQMRLDRGLLERIREPVYHLLRNSIIHGIESPEERGRRNKPQEAALVLRFEKEVGCARISCSDDGRGLDPVSIRRKAVETGLISREDAETLSDEDALYLILRSGFTTAGTLTELAGRGVGLDVVKGCVSGLGGTLAIESEKGAFTCFTLTLPLSVDLLPVFAVRAAGRNCLIPLHNTVETRLVKAEEIGWEAGRPVVLEDGAPVSLVSLAERLGVVSGRPVPVRQKVLLLRSNIDTIALGVDEIVGREAVIPRPLAGRLANVRHIRASAILGNGEPAFILDVPGLLEGVKAMPPEIPERKASPEPPSIMVVDDSLTTRALIQGILTTEGYGVIPAASGEEALSRLTGRKVALLIIDIEMPGMDGFELSERIRRLPDHRQTPIVILSSHGSDADKRRGIEVGANAFLVKGSFEQNEFLTTVERLIQ